MRVEFLPEAEDDIDRLYEFLIDLNPLTAQKAMLVIDDATDALKANPRLGTRLPGDPHFRQKPVFFGKYGYVMQYRVEEDALIVARIWQGREQRVDPSGS